jgi:hypothetical protein
MAHRLLVLAWIAVVLLIGAATAEASCIQQTAAQQRARADVIFDGVALEGPTATGIQRFRVNRYRKGRGPAVVRVQTGNRIFDNGTLSITSVSIIVRKGQRWRIFARGSAAKVLQTNVCDGSRRL